jgi:pyrroline-5-carboxylate reductase
VAGEYRRRVSEYELALVGGGNMGAALLSGLIDAGTFDGLAVVETSTPRRAVLVEEYPDVDVLAEMPPCAAAVLATKPADTRGAATAAVEAGAVRLLSIAAGVTTSAIEAAVGPGVVVVRAMPNTPALVGRGMSAIAAGTQAGDDDLLWAESILGAVGRVERLPESLFDAFTALVGSGPAYLFLVAEALVDAGVAAGLPRPVAVESVTQLMVGSAELLEQRGDAVALRAMVTSPGGTTAAGLAELERNAVRAAFVDAVAAAAARSRDLG